eukprot:8943892-Pyramimonas_sp.AAC.1
MAAGSKDGDRAAPDVTALAARGAQLQKSEGLQWERKDRGPSIIVDVGPFGFLKLQRMRDAD